MSFRQRFGSPDSLRLLGVMALATALRCWGLFHDLPYSFFGDELHFVKRSMALGAGDLNPHWFHKPAFMMYILLFFYGSYYVIGASLGRFESVEAFAAEFLHDQGVFILIGRLFVAACGIGSVYLVNHLARRMFKSRRAGLCAGLSAAVLLPMVEMSQVVKADVPCAFLILLSLSFYLRYRDSERLLWLVVASLLAGAAIGTKYYGLILLVPYCVTELSRALTGQGTWRQATGRGLLISFLFIAGFFATSPYNFLDPTFFEKSVLARVERAAGLSSGVSWDADNEIEYEGGAMMMVGAAQHAVGKLLSPEALGVAPSILVAAGLWTLLRRRRLRDCAGITGGTAAAFLFMAAFFSPYHANARHLLAIIPLLCVLVWPGMVLLTRVMRVPASWRATFGSALLVASLMPSFARVVGHNIWRTREDTRVTAVRWIQEQLPGNGRILLDDYGPELFPDASAIARLERRISDLNLEGASFSRYELQRLDLLRRYPPPVSFDMEKLGHPWWLPREIPPEELLTQFRHLDTSNPIVDRFPKTLAEYRAEGVRYVITNSRARRRYFSSQAEREAFPSWVRFYEDLESRKCLKVLDPARSGGKGPVIWIYDLG